MPPVASAAYESPSRLPAGAVHEWDGVVEPVVVRSARGVRVSRPGAIPGEFQQLLEDLAARSEFELQLPEPAELRSKILQVLWQERGGKVAAVDVLYGRPAGGSTGYWLAGQRRRAAEDAAWKGSKRTVAVATRFWKQRDLMVTVVGPEGTAGSSQQQLYRFYDGVESWVAGDLSASEAAVAAASFHEINRRGITPLLALGVGFVIIFIWPAYGALAASRRYQAKVKKHNRPDRA